MSDLGIPPAAQEEDQTTSESLTTPLHRHSQPHDTTDFPPNMSDPVATTEVSLELLSSTSTTGSDQTPTREMIDELPINPTKPANDSEITLVIRTDNATPSPPSSLSPSFAAEACPQLDRSVSTASSVSSVSGRSTSSRLSDPGLPVKKRGYMRPQATNFAESAKNRESVMSLGSIAHLQYYFARTGLLDGKGGQLARKKMQFKAKPEGMQRSVSMGMPGMADTSPPSPTMSSYPLSDNGAMVDSPIDQGEDLEWDFELALLPPTVSTYNVRPAYVPPPPDLTMLRRELTEALEDALKVLKESEKSGDQEDTQGWYEIQGLHLLDITTLAIRAAKNYYTAHSHFHRLHAIKSERAIRQELYQVLEILKRMAARNFAGGIRQAEKVSILTWIVGISELIQTEINQEKREAEEREKWSWRSGDWTGREREREHAFIKCFIEDPDSLPEWSVPSPADSEVQQPTPFLLYFQNGLHLVKLHNTLVRRSKRQFEEIKSYHTDTNKPYRCAENLRFWIKAAELRWDVFLKMDVLAVVQGSNMDAWRQFDVMLLKWCKGVREEFIQEYEAKDLYSRKTPPRLQVEAEATSSAPMPQMLRSETI